MKYNLKNKIVVLLCLVVVVLSSSCGYGTDNFFYKGNKVDSRVDNVVEINDFISPETAKLSKYRILVLADVHVGGYKTVTDYEILFNWLKDLKKNDPDNFPKFCLILGDNVDHGYKSEFIDFVDFTKEIEKLEIPVINVLGNHDLYNSGWKNYKSMCYPFCSLFHFSTKNFSWYGIDTGTGDIGIKQFNILKRAMAKDNKPKIVMTHYPFSNTRLYGILCLHDPTERNLIIDLFARSDVKAALCGHLHQTQAADLQAFDEYGNPSFRYCKNGWNIFEIDEDNCRVKKISLDYPDY